MNRFVTRDRNGRGRGDAYIKENGTVDVGMDICEIDFCLLSDNKMAAEEAGYVN